MLDAQEKFLLSLINDYFSSYYDVILSQYVEIVFVNDFKSQLERNSGKISIIIPKNPLYYDKIKYVENIGTVKMEFLGRLKPEHVSQVNFDQKFANFYKIDNSYIFEYNMYNGLINAVFYEYVDFDAHYRHISEVSEIHKNELNDFPLLNQFCFLLRMLLINLKLIKQTPVKFDLQITHDVDSLSGLDLYKQGKRLVNILSANQPMKNLKFFLVNLLFPNKYHLNNVRRIIDLERSRDIKSLWFILNGKKGRFHARTSTKKLAILKDYIPKGQIGIHYNYDTFESEYNLIKQLDDFERHFGFRPSIGRAHYLRLSTTKSFETVYKFIDHDFSTSFTDNIGFKSSIAATHASQYNGKLSTPLYAMDSNVHGRLDRLESTMQRLVLIGGTLSLLVHHDYVYNHENDKQFDLLEKIIEIYDKYIPHNTY